MFKICLNNFLFSFKDRLYLPFDQFGSQFNWIEDNCWTFVVIRVNYNPNMLPFMKNCIKHSTEQLINWFGISWYILLITGIYHAKYRELCEIRISHANLAHWVHTYVLTSVFGSSLIMCHFCSNLHWAVMKKLIFIPLSVTFDVQVNGIFSCVAQ